MCVWRERERVGVCMREERVCVWGCVCVCESERESGVWVWGVVWCV